MDPVFIFGLDMGVVGAAAATVIGQISGACIGFFLLWRIRGEFSVSFRGFRPNRVLSAELLRIAAPAVVMQSLSSFMSLGLNQLLTLWSDTAVFVLGVYFKIQSFVFMPIFGVNSGLIPILSYNYGAKSASRLSQAVRFGVQLALSAKIQSFVFMPIFGVNSGLIPILSYNYGAKSASRLSQAVRFGVQLALSAAAAGAVLLVLAAGPLLRYCFHAGDAAAAMGVPALRMAALSFPIAAVSIILSAAFQSLGNSGSSLLISLLRQILLLLPIAALFLWLAPDGVWLSFLLTEALTCLVTLLLYRRTVRPLTATLAIPGDPSPPVSSTH